MKAAAMFWLYSSVEADIKIIKHSIQNPVKHLRWIFLKKKLII